MHRTSMDSNRWPWSSASRRGCAAFSPDRFVTLVAALISPEERGACDM